MEELARLDARNKQAIPAKLISCLMGRHGFYKAITDDRRQTTRIKAININGASTALLGKTAQLQ